MDMCRQMEGGAEQTDSMSRASRTEDRALEAQPVLLRSGAAVR